MNHWRTEANTSVIQVFPALTAIHHFIILRARPLSDRPSAAARIKAVLHHKCDVCTYTQIINTFTAAEGWWRATVRTAFSFHPFQAFMSLKWFETDGNQMRPLPVLDTLSTVWDVVYVSRCDKFWPEFSTCCHQLLHSSCGVQLFRWENVYLHCVRNVFLKHWIFVWRAGWPRTSEFWPQSNDVTLPVFKYWTYNVTALLTMTVGSTSGGVFISHRNAFIWFSARCKMSHTFFAH